MFSFGPVHCPAPKYCRNSLVFIFFLLFFYKFSSLFHNIFPILCYWHRKNCNLQLQKPFFIMSDVISNLPRSFCRRGAKSSFLSVEPSFFSLQLKTAFFHWCLMIVRWAMSIYKHCYWKSCITFHQPRKENICYIFEKFLSRYSSRIWMTYCTVKLEGILKLFVEVICSR